MVEQAVAHLRNLSILAALLGSATAGATARVAALVPQLRPAASTELRDRFHAAVTRGLEETKGEVLTIGEVRMRLGAAPDLIGCSGESGCVQRAATLLRATLLVATELDVAGKSYAFKLRLLDDSGKELGQVSEACDICTVSEAEETALKAAAQLAVQGRALAQADQPAPAVAEPTPPSPKGAEASAPPGEASEASTPSAGAEEPAPALAGTVAAQPAPKRFPFRAVAIGSFVAGVVGIAVGIPLLVIDGRPTCDLPDGRTSCPDLYNTTGGGAAMVAIGVAGLAAGGLLLYFDHRSRKASRNAPVVSISPLLGGGAQLTARGRF